MPWHSILFLPEWKYSLSVQVFGLKHTRPTYFPNTDGLFKPESSDWDVFSPEGAWLGVVELIPRRYVAQIGADWILMFGEDELGVARIWLHDLIKP